MRRTKKHGVYGLPFYFTTDGGRHGWMGGLLGNGDGVNNYFHFTTFPLHLLPRDLVTCLLCRIAFEGLAGEWDGREGARM